MAYASATKWLSLLFIVYISVIVLFGCKPTSGNEQEIIARLELQPVEPGAYLKEVYRSTDTIDSSKNLYTSAYYLITPEFQDTFHRLTSDEVWYHLEGSSITLYILLPNGELKTVTLGKNRQQGDLDQFQVPKNSWYVASIPNNQSYALCALMMSPGFSPGAFTLANRDTLLKQYPEHQTLIERFTKISNRD